MAIVRIEAGQSSASMISDSGNSEFYEMRKRRDQISGEVTELLDHLLGGAGADAKHLRREVTRSIFGVLSKDNAAEMSLQKVERGLKILQAFEKRAQREQNLLTAGELNILAQLDIDIKEHDDGVAEDQEMPF